MRYGLFGGTFDPIHLGHTTLASAARDRFRLDLVYFIPCRQSPHKDAPASASREDRCRMIEIGTEDFSWARLSTIELDRTGPSYSWQTLSAFRNMNPGAELFWILGNDQWEAIERWANPDYLRTAATFLVFPRGGDPTPKPGFRMKVIPVRHPANATEIRDARGEVTDHLNPRVARYIRREGLYT